MSTLDPSTGFTCVTCRLVFKTAELQRDHYRTDWHRYNLKRQVADLLPVTDEQFRSKVLAHREEKHQAAREADELSSLACETCSKRFNSQNAYSDHLRSKKHSEIVKNGKKGPKQPLKKVATTPDAEAKTSAGEDKEMSEDEGSDSSGWQTDNGTDDEDDEGAMWEYDEKDALPETLCLFCPQSTSSLEKNLEHMKTRHGFSIPDNQYCADLQGMVRYLGLKVGAGRVCIFCPETKGRYPTLTAVRQHMIDKQHCKLSREPPSMLEFADWYDYSPLFEELADKEAPVDDGWTLTLPSGAKIGHRSLLRYYKQYVRGVSEATQQGRLAIEKASGPKALSWIGGSSANGKAVVPQSALVRAAKDIRMMERARRRFDLRAAVWSNKLFKTRGRVGDN